MKHCMLDQETLGVTATAVILSIGAVKFDLETGEIDDSGFYASLSIDDQLRMGRTIDESTLIWWLGQDATAQKVFHEPKQSLESALISLSDWLGHNKWMMWSNGADFDLPMLAHAFTSYDMQVPWEFWNSRCMRTYKSLPAAKNVTKPKNDHNALRDAVNQAQYVSAIHAVMKAAA